MLDLMGTYCWDSKLLIGQACGWQDGRGKKNMHNFSVETTWKTTEI
jgi:hypothetical protein